MYDLHFHTNLSDGANTSANMVDAAIDRWARLLSCTDHDIVNRDIREYVSQFHSRVDGILFQEYPYIDVVDWAEVSVCYFDEDYQKSLHITTYALCFSGKYDDFLASIRKGKSGKIQLQCMTLASHGFHIPLPSWECVPWSLDNLLLCYPSNHPDSMNNMHIQETFIACPSNIQLLSRMTNWELNASNFLSEWLKKEGKYTKILSLPFEVPSYEPTFESLIDNLDIENTVISLPHPNFTFRTIDEFSKRIRGLVDLGLNAVEINTTASREWVEVILKARKRYGLLLTFWSDSHGIGKVDTYHGDFAMLNPHILPYSGALEYWKEQFLLKAYGYNYRMMKSGEYS